LVIKKKSVTTHGNVNLMLSATDAVGVAIASALCVKKNKKIANAPAGPRDGTTEDHTTHKKIF
jgi:hypothetical protein